MSRLTDVIAQAKSKDTDHPRHGVNFACLFTSASRRGNLTARSPSFKSMSQS